jgi:uncharacterized protein YecT (DUF1311 family)
MTTRTYTPLLATMIIAASLATTHKVSAGQPRINCAKAYTTYEMNMCADRDYRSADAKLNRAYKDAQAQTRDRDLEKPYSSKEWKASLRSSQRDWIKHRDSDCKGLVPQEWSGGSGTTVAVLSCMTDKTVVRTNELKSRYGR